MTTTTTWTDLADQFHNHYHFYHWLCKHKRWWSIFLWEIGIGTTNAYIMYDPFYKEEKTKKSVMPEKLSHLDFILGFIDDLMGWSNERLAATTATVASGVSTTCHSSSFNLLSSSTAPMYDISTPEGREEWFEKNKTTPLTKVRLDSDFFAVRFNEQFQQTMPTIDTTSYCQFCYYKFKNYLNPAQIKKSKWMHNHHASIFRCLTCSVNLSWGCKFGMTWVWLWQVGKNVDGKGEWG